MFNEQINKSAARCHLILVFWSNWFKVKCISIVSGRYTTQLRRARVEVVFSLNSLLLHYYFIIFVESSLQGSSFYFLSLSTNPCHGNNLNNMVSTLLLFLVEFPIWMIYHQTVSSFCFLSLITNVFTLKCFLCKHYSINEIYYDSSSSGIEVVIVNDVPSSIN